MQIEIVITETRVDYFAHIGGLVYGILLTFLNLPPKQIEDQSEEIKIQHASRQRKIKFAAIGGLAVVTVVFTIALFARTPPNISTLAYAVCLLKSLT